MVSETRQKFCMAFLALFFVYTGYLWLTDDSTPRTATATTETPREKDHSTTAFVMAKQYVKGRLKSPATADFPWYSRDFVTNAGNGTYYVKSYVDSQNEFSAMIRTQFICELSTPDGDNWTLKNLATE